MPTSPRRASALASNAYDGATSAVSRRALAKGAAWAAPAIIAASAAPAYAVSPGKIDVRYHNLNGCLGPGNDANTYINLTNNTTQDITLKTPLVLRVVISNPDRSRAASSSNVGTQKCSTGGLLTFCTSVLWTIPVGTVFRAGQTIDMAWHLFVDYSDPAYLTVTQESGDNVLSNPSSTSTAQGWTGPSGCVSHGEY